MPEIDIIKRNFDEYYEMADYALSRKKFNSAVTLYYKALVELCDYDLLIKLKKIGINHNERFELLRNASPEVYRIASKLFGYYRDSYSKEISETIAQRFKVEVENVRKKILK